MGKKVYPFIPKLSLRDFYIALYRFHKVDSC